MAQTNMGIALPNDEARQAFIADYTNEEHGWYLWVETPEVQRKWWRRDFNGWSLVIEEAVHAVRMRIPHVVYKQTNMIMHMYMVDGDLPLESYITFKKEVMSRLRDITRDGGTV